MIVRLLPKPLKPFLKRMFSSSMEELKGTGKDGEITNMDILKWRANKHKYVREIEVGGQKQKWNYRSELVKRHDLDGSHRRVWMAFGILIVLGLSSFVAVKANVIAGRRQQMLEREALRKSLNLEGEDRKRIGFV